MDFDLSEDQVLFKSSLERMLSDHFSFDKQQKIQAGHSGKGQEWPHLAELGVLGLTIDEEYGGFGGGPVETTIVMEAFGRYLIKCPYLTAVVLCAHAVDLVGTKEQKQDLLRRVAEGSLKLAWAHGERQARYDLNHVTTQAISDGSQWVLNGEKNIVAYAEDADMLVVSARTSGENPDQTGITLFLIDRQSEGLILNAYDTHDGMRAADATFSNVRIEQDAVLGTIDQAAPTIHRVTDFATVALCSEAVGAMAALHELTVDYMKVRQQFGVPIGSFQALQHRAVDMLIALEQARSMALYATLIVGSDDPHQRQQAVSAAKVQINRSARLIGQQAIQLHGGIGMTMEYQAGHYFKRLTSIESQLGDTDYHAKRLEDIE